MSWIVALAVNTLYRRQRSVPVGCWLLRRILRPAESHILRAFGHSAPPGSLPLPPLFRYPLPARAVTSLTTTDILVSLRGTFKESRISRCRANLRDLSLYKAPHSPPPQIQRYGHGGRDNTAT